MLKIYIYFNLIYRRNIKKLVARYPTVVTVCCCSLKKLNRGYVIISRYPKIQSRCTFTNKLKLEEFLLYVT